MKTRKVCIKARSPPASLPLKGKVTKHTTVKWTIARPNVAEFSYFSKYTDNTKKKAMKCFLQSKCTFKNVIFFTVVFQESLKFFFKSLPLRVSILNRKTCPHCVCDKWMLILKGRFYRFQLPNRHFKDIQIFLRTFCFQF